MSKINLHCAGNHYLSRYRKLTLALLRNYEMQDRKRIYLRANGRLSKQIIRFAKKMSRPQDWTAQKATRGVETMAVIKEGI